eukprot:NODE_29196_length_453_cov_3.162577.p2 GENE.NODE_29196_length_453_cov_3.162577~~NODE_29196_length_453_cov_3.162577.p2  ORF type:complete len:58 (+),score=0.29 NODE_29196_length_453_cov_3.162577:170-343(+)
MRGIDCADIAARRGALAPVRQATAHAEFVSACELNARIGRSDEEDIDASSGASRLSR